LQVYDWKSCESISVLSEYEVLDELISAQHQRLGRDLFCLEVGSYRGQSTVLLAQYGTVFAVDLWADIHDGMLNVERAGQENLIEFLDTMRRFNLIAEQRVFPVISTSAFLDCLFSMELDVIYIDGSHYYDDARLDIQRTEKHLSLTGIYIFHDYKRPGDNADLGVNRAVDELLEPGDYRVQKHFEGLICLERRWLYEPV
jgi:hypothetical protein